MGTGGRSCDFSGNDRGVTVVILPCWVALCFPQARFCNFLNCYFLQNTPLTHTTPAAITSAFPLSLEGEGVRTRCKRRENSGEGSFLRVLGAECLGSGAAVLAGAALDPTMAT